MLLLDLWGCDRRLLHDSEAMAALVARIVALAGMTPIGPPDVWVCDDAASNWGCGVSVNVKQWLAESHIILHTLADLGYAHLDVFACKPFDADAVERDVVSALGATNRRRWLLDRTIGLRWWRRLLRR
jgi:S-adenosylmethionine/arginine decarboxylase-like enzyme